MYLVSMSTLAEMEAAAKWIVANETLWLQNPRRIVCWLAVWLRMRAGISLARAADDAAVDPKRVRALTRTGRFPMWRKEQLPLMARVLRDALKLRRIEKDLPLDDAADLAATALTYEAPEMEAPPVMRAAEGGEHVREAAFEEAPDSAGADDGADATPWAEQAHPAQLAPEAPWRTWMLMGGRGAGKTRAGAEWVRARVERGEAKRIALVGPTLHDVREVMIGGPSGLCAIGPMAARPTYEVTRRRLKWPEKGPFGGAVAYAFSAEDPDSLRGPQFDTAWCDEIGAWAKDVETWRTLAFAMRLGESPRIVATTTPRPRALVKLLAEKAEAGSGGVVLTQASTRANAQNLAPDFVSALEEDYGGTELGRQEIDGALIEDLQGAMWTRAMIEDTRATAEEAERLERVVVAVDPPVSAGPRSDACGIVVAGVKDGVVYVLSDATVRGLRPAQWAERVARAAEAWGAEMVVVEANQGGELVREVLEHAVGRELRVKLEHAAKTKAERAQPVSVLYTKGRVRHVRVLKELEDEMCSFGAPDAEKRSRSPDRLDALVWAVTVLTRKPPVKPEVSEL